MAMFSLEEAASFLGLDPRELELLVKRGEIEAYKIAGVYLRFKQNEISDFKDNLTQEKKLNKKKLPRKKSVRRLTRESMLDNELSLAKVSLIERVQDFWYFNNFYIVSLGVMFFLIRAILK